MKRTQTTLVNRNVVAQSKRCVISEIWKVRADGLKGDKLFKLIGNVFNADDQWKIYVWSQATDTWNCIAAVDEIPGIKHVCYINCTKENGGERIPCNDFTDNMEAMLLYVRKFCSALGELNS